MILVRAPQLQNRRVVVSTTSTHPLQVEVANCEALSVDEACMDILVVCIEMKDIKLERNEDHKKYCGDVINELRLLGIQLGIDIWKYVIIVLIKVDALRLSTKEFVRRP